MGFISAFKGLSKLSSYKYNVSINNTTFYFIHNKYSILSGRHVSTYNGSSSGPLGKTEPRAVYISVRCGIPNAFGIPQKVETCHPDNIIFLLYIK